MFVRETCIAGGTVEVREYHSRKFNRQGQKRGAVIATTPEKQSNRNAQIAERRARRLLNANFSAGAGWHITLTYRKDARPTPPDSKSQIARVLRKLRAAYKQHGAELKYMLGSEVTEKGVPHYHLVVPAAQLGDLGDVCAYVCKLWADYGAPKITPLYSANLARLASYIAKRDTKPLCRGEAQDGKEYTVGKRWSCSKNLDQPQICKEIVAEDTWTQTPVVPTGWMLETDSLQYGVGEETGYPYREYSLVRVTPGAIYPQREASVWTDTD